MAGKPSRTREYILIGGYGAILVAFLGAGLLPHLRGVAAAREQIAQYQANIETQRAQSAELREINSQVELIKAQTKDYPRLISTEEPALFVQEISKQLSEAGVRDPVFQGMQRSPLTHSEKTPIEVHCKCTYAQLHDFLRRLEKLDRLSSVGHLTIDAESTMGGTIDVQLTLFIYNVKSAG
jgi:Tfp pilus assembly protein PilO